MSLCSAQSGADTNVRFYVFRKPSRLVLRATVQSCSSTAKKRWELFQGVYAPILLNRCTSRPQSPTALPVSGMSYTCAGPGRRLPRKGTESVGNWPGKALWGLFLPPLRCAGTLVLGFVNTCFLICANFPATVCRPNEPPKFGSLGPLGRPKSYPPIS